MLEVQQEWGVSIYRKDMDKTHTYHSIDVGRLTFFLPTRILLVGGILFFFVAGLISMFLYVCCFFALKMRVCG